MNVMYKNRNAIVILLITVIHNSGRRNRQEKPVSPKLIFFWIAQIGSIVDGQKRWPFHKDISIFKEEFQ